MSARDAPLQVVAAVLRDAQGRVLLARRAAGREHAGLWEFPGGKREAGETAHAALARELDEELGVQVVESTPLWRVPWPGTTRDLVLDAHEVAIRGEPVARDHDALAWVAPAELHLHHMPPADGPIATALRLPRTCAITPDEVDPYRIEAALRSALAAGAVMIQLRAPRLHGPALAEIARRAAALTGAAGAMLILHGDASLAADLGLAGAHLPAAYWRERVRPSLSPGMLVGASCHDCVELARVRDAGADYVVLGPVRATATHPEATPLGWERFSELARASALPVFAIGGLVPGDLERARAAGAFGVAGIRGFA